MKKEREISGPVSCLILIVFFASIFIFGSFIDNLVKNGNFNVFEYISDDFNSYFGDHNGNGGNHNQVSDSDNPYDYYGEPEEGETPTLDYSQDADFLNDNGYFDDSAGNYDSDSFNDWSDDYYGN